MHDSSIAHGHPLADSSISNAHEYPMNSRPGVYQAKLILDEAMRRLRLACPMSRDGFENAIIEYRGGGVAIYLAHAHGLSRLLSVAQCYLCCQLPIK